MEGGRHTANIRFGRGLHPLWWPLVSHEGGETEVSQTQGRILCRNYGWPPRFGVGKGKAARVDFAPSAVHWVGEEMPCVRYDQQTTAAVLVHRVADITLNGIEGLAVSKESGLEQIV